jgi:hypothetical protein
MNCGTLHLFSFRLFWMKAQRSKYLCVVFVNAPRGWKGWCLNYDCALIHFGVQVGAVGGSSWSARTTQVDITTSLMSSWVIHHHCATHSLPEISSQHPLWLHTYHTYIRTYPACRKNPLVLMLLLNNVHLDFKWACSAHVLAFRLHGSTFRLENLLLFSAAIFHKGILYWALIIVAIKDVEFIFNDFRLNSFRLAMPKISLIMKIKVIENCLPYWNWCCWKISMIFKALS